MAIVDQFFGDIAKSSLMICTVTIKGAQFSFESPFSDDEAVRTLRAHIARGQVMSSFTNDLIQKHDEVEPGAV